MKTPGKWLLPWVLIFSPTGFAASKPCQLRLASQVNVQFDPAGAVIVPVSLNGHAGMMLLELSSGLPGLFDSYIGELGLGDSLRRTDWIATFGDKKIEKQALVASTLLGQANFTGWDYQVLPAGQSYRPEFNGLPVFGVMTSAFMNVVDLELNLREGRLNLFHPNKCNGMPVYWESEVTGVSLNVDLAGHLSFPMEVEGKLIQASLHTAGKYSEISKEAASRYMGFDPGSPDVEQESTPGSPEKDMFRPMSLTAKGLEISNSRIRIKDMPDCSLGAGLKQTGRHTRNGVGSAAIVCTDVLALTPFSIGTDLMKRLRIYMSLADEKIYFTPSIADPGKPEGPT